MDRERARALGERGHLHVLRGGLRGIAILGFGLTFGSLSIRGGFTLSRCLTIRRGLFTLGGSSLRLTLRLRLRLRRPLVFPLGVGGDDELAGVLREQRHLLGLELEDVDAGYGQVAGFLEFVSIVVHRPLEPELDLDVVQTVVGDSQALDVRPAVVTVRVHGTRVGDRVSLRVLHALLPRRRWFRHGPVVEQRPKLELARRLELGHRLGDDELVRDEVIRRTLRRFGLFRDVHVAEIVGDGRVIAPSLALERLDLLAADAFKREVLGEVANLGGFKPDDDLHGVARPDVPPGDRLHLFLLGLLFGRCLSLGTLGNLGNLGTLLALSRLRRRGLPRVRVLGLNRRSENLKLGRRGFRLPLLGPRDDLEHLRGWDVVQRLRRGGHGVGVLVAPARRDVDDGARIFAFVGDHLVHPRAVVGVRHVRGTEER